MTTIKFCGLTRSEDAAFAAELGASHVGAIFAPSARKVSAETASMLFAAAGASVMHVGVFGSSSADEVAAIAEAVGLDVVQLHGPVDDDFLAILRKSFSGDIWPVVGVEDSVAEAAARVAAARHASAVVLDTARGGRTGGTGEQFDWAGLSEHLPVSGRIPIVVAGGLTPLNVAVAIAALRPDIVDVSSGVESAPGIKDHNLMRAFAEAVHSASMV